MFVEVYGVNGIYIYIYIFSSIIHIFFFFWHLYYVAVTEGVEKATIEDETVDKKDRTVVKDKSAKLEAKLERENKKKMVTKIHI